MDTITTQVSVRELRARTSDLLGRTSYGHERVGITRNGKISAVLIGVEDLESLEQLEMAQDVAAYREAKAEDDGTRLSLEEVRADVE